MSQVFAVPVLGAIPRDTGVGGDPKRILLGTTISVMFDTLFGEDGADQFFGGTGNDVLNGSGGNDTLRGEDRNDKRRRLRRRNRHGRQRHGLRANNG